MIRAKGGQLSRQIVRQIRWTALVFGALGIFVLPASTRAAFAGVWQTPLTTWLVDGYGFGEPTDYGYHLGEDAHGDPGTPVYAGANGLVKLTADMTGGGWGGLVLIEHTTQAGDKVVSLHGHLDPRSFQVAEGQVVSRGQLVGDLGDSAHSGGWIPQLHYGIRNGRYMDAWAGEDWVYAGYGDAQALAEWSKPTDYIEAHKHVIEVQRVPENSPNRYATAVGVSTRLFPKAGSVAQLFLANGTMFADALAAAPLATTANGPLLLATKDVLPAETKAEIKRVLHTGGTVRLLGGLATLSYKIESAINSMGIHTERVAGNSREGTAVYIAEKFPAAKSVFIVNRDAFPDAVSAGGPANVSGLPLLFTSTTSLSDITERYLKQHPGITNAYIVGGESVVSSAVAAELKQIKSLAKVVRLAGANRYDTNLKLVQTFTAKPETLVFATGENFPDALTGSSLVGGEKGSLLLTKPDGFSSTAHTFIEGTRPALDVALVLGGTTAVAATLDTQLAAELNAPLTLAAASVPQTPKSAKPLALSSTTSISLAGISVPAIDGFTKHEQIIKDAVVASMSTSDQSVELVPPYSIARIPMHGRSAQETLAAWFGVPTTYIASHQKNQGDYQTLTDMPSIAPMQMVYSTNGDTLTLASIYLPDELAQTVLNKIVSQF